MFLYVQHAVNGKNKFEGPLYEIDAGPNSDNDKPPPNKEKYHLVEQIHRKYALYGIVMYVMTHYSNTEITHGDSGKPSRSLPGNPVYEVKKSSYPIQGVAISEEFV